MEFRFLFKPKMVWHTMYRVWFVQQKKTKRNETKRNQLLTFYGFQFKTTVKRKFIWSHGILQRNFVNKKLQSSNFPFTFPHIFPWAAWLQAELNSNTHSRLKNLTHTHSVQRQIRKVFGKNVSLYWCLLVMMNHRFSAQIIKCSSSFYLPHGYQSNSSSSSSTILRVMTVACDVIYTAPTYPTNHIENEKVSFSFRIQLRSHKQPTWRVIRVVFVVVFLHWIMFPIPNKIAAIACLHSIIVRLVYLI